MCRTVEDPAKGPVLKSSVATSAPTARATSISTRRLVVAALVVCFAVLAFAEVASAATVLQPPATIKVARRWPANDPNGKIYRVDEVDFRTYCVRVLSHEWAPAASFSPEALEAGALAVKSYGWYWASRPTKLADVAAWGADVDDSVNYQVYMDTDYGDKYWAAVDAVSGLVLTQNGSILQASYRAGEYTSYRSGWYMSQWGTQYWADNGKSHEWMCDYYYRGVELTPIAGGVTTGETAAGEAQPNGDPRLELIGPLIAAPAKPSRGDKVEITFTLRNAGAESATWDRLTVVGRGPNDRVRDFGTVETLKFTAGEYRMFAAKRTVDVGGTWRVWLVAWRGDKPTLVGAAEPFSFVVSGGAQGPATSADGSTVPTGPAGRHMPADLTTRLQGPRRPPVLQSIDLQTLGAGFPY
jgi:hypothetical protein